MVAFFVIAECVCFEKPSEGVKASSKCFRLNIQDCNLTVLLKYLFFFFLWIHEHFPSNCFSILGSYCLAICTTKVP